MTGSKCKICGEPIRRAGNYYVCDVCGNKWEIDSGNDVHAVERANAWIALRDSDFERATELFEEIILKEKEPDNYEAYWGRALATGAIVYVTDLSEDKKVPTCNNITEESFVGNKDVQKAISLAPADIAATYRKQAEQIEKIRIEWLEKASKEPAYDVFICYKDSDRENGLERTQDSIDAQDLYNALVAEGYKVFFSRISLRDKVAEQYEPYIYNAIRTAKVMIVFGEKPEYFRAVWLKNEWGRFKTRIEKGEKHKNSLVVVYKNMNPGDLPVILKSRQCLNAADMTFFSDLNRHIKKVIEASQQAARLEKIKIEGGQIAKKATTISNNTIQTRDVGKGAIAETSISEQQTLSVANTYLTAKEWDEAKSLVDDVLFSNPSYAEAIWCSLLIKYKASDNAELLKKLNSLTDEDYQIIEKVLNCADKKYAGEILAYLYDSGNNADISAETYRKILNLILPYNFDLRTKKIEAAFNIAIGNRYFDILNALLETLGSDDVDKYIAYNYEFAKNISSDDIKLECLNRILKVHEGNSDALNMLFEIKLKDASAAELAKIFEEILKYSPQPNRCVEKTLEGIITNLSEHRHCEFAVQLLKYYTDDLAKLKDRLIQLAYKMIEKSFFDDAQYILNLALTFAPDNSDIYWGICLLKTKSEAENKIFNSPILLKSVPEFIKYLTLVDEKRRLECLAITKKQENKIQEAERQREAARLAVQRQEEERRRRAERERARRKKLITIIIAVVTVAVAVFAAIFITLYSVVKDKKARAGLKYTMSKDGTYYIVSGVENDKLTEYTVPKSYKGKPIAEIGANAFKDSQATSITIPDSVTTIGVGAFSGCSNLESITLPFVGGSRNPSNVNFQYPLGYIFGANSYEGGVGTTQYFYKAQDSYHNTYYIPEKLKDVTVTGGNIYYGAFYNCTILESITIGDGITTISSGAFYGCSNLESLTIPFVGDSVKAPDDNNQYPFGYIFGTKYYGGSVATMQYYYAYYHGSSTNRIASNTYYIPEKLKTVTVMGGNILYGAFYGCTKLESITIPDSVTSIGSYAFYNCTSITSITIPTKATDIRNYAFAYCSNLTSIVIPRSVAYIGDSAFYACTRLKTVYYGGTSSQWYEISIWEGNNNLKDAKRIYYVENSAG